MATYRHWGVAKQLNIPPGDIDDVEAPGDDSEESGVAPHPSGQWGMRRLFAYLRSFRNPNVHQRGMNVDLVDGKHASSFGNVQMNPDAAGPVCNALCFAAPDPDNPDVVVVQDSGVSTADIGDVTGPGSATGDNLTAFDGTTGKIIKDSGIAMADVAAVVDATATKALNSANVAALAAFPVWHKVTHTFEDFVGGSGNVSLEALPAGTVWHMALAVTTEAFAAEGDPDITMEVSSALPISFIRSMNVKILNQQPEVSNEGDSRLWPPMDLGNAHTPVASLAFVDTGGGGGASDLTAGSVDIYLLLSKLA